MCGIAGFVSHEGIGSDAEARAIRMREVLVHRGPDEAGLHLDAHAALAHRRLSIVDLSTGQQPTSNEDGTVWIVFNGEIYNHTDIRRDLENRGHRYRSRSDTETIVHAYEEWGDECVHQLRGMFAFAIWDAPAGRGDRRHAVSSSADLQRESSGEDVHSRGSRSAGLPAYASLRRGAPERGARRRQACPEVVRQFRGLLEESVRLRLMA